MKKITSLILALVMALSLTTAAFAADPSNYGGAAKGDVKITTITGEDGNPTMKDNTWNIDVWAGHADSTLSSDDAAAVKANFYVVVNWTVDSNITYQVDKNTYAWAFYKDTTGTETADTTKDTVLSAGFKADAAKWAGKATVTVNITNWSNRAIKANYAWDYAEAAGNITEKATGFKVTGTDEQRIESAAKDIIDNLKNNTGASLLTTTGKTNTPAVIEIDASTATAGKINGNCAIGHVTVTITETV